jgi:hypothetical protein
MISTEVSDESTVRSFGCLAFVIALTAPAIRADVTIRYRSDSKLVPAAMADRKISIKGNRARFVINNLSAVADFGKQELTVLDPSRKAYATLPISQLCLPQIPICLR